MVIKIKDIYHKFQIEQFTYLSKKNLQSVKLVT